MTENLFERVCEDRCFLHRYTFITIVVEYTLHPILYILTKNLKRPRNKFTITRIIKPTEFKKNTHIITAQLIKNDNIARNLQTTEENHKLWRQFANITHLQTDDKKNIGRKKNSPINILKLCLYIINST